LTFNLHRVKVQDTVGVAMIITKHYDINAKGRDFLIGDLHGCYAKLMAKMDEVSFNRSVDRLFSVGDMIDKGPESAKCLGLLDEEWFLPGRGNHEDMLLAYLFSVETIDKGSRKSWKTNGGKWFDVTDPVMRSLVEKIEKLPLISVINTKSGRVNVVHAEFPINCTDEMIDRQAFNWYQIGELIWGRNRAEIYDEDTTVEFNDDGLSPTYVGHTPVTKPLTIGNYNYIDTAVWKKDGYLTMIQLT
jgi:serine/threonine protein phosphatase 1